MSVFSSASARPGYSPWKRDVLGGRLGGDTQDWLMVGGQAGEWAGTCGTRAQAAQQHLVARAPLPPSAAIPGPFLTPRACPVLGSRLVGLRPGPFSLRTSLPDGQMVPSVVPAPLSPGCVPPVVRAVWRWAAHRADHSCGSHVLPGAWRHAGATSPVCTQEAGPRRQVLAPALRGCRPGR